MKGIKQHHYVTWIVATVGIVIILGLTPTLRSQDLPKERLVRPLLFIAYSVGEEKNIGEAHKLIAADIEKLGFQLDFKPMLRSGVLQNTYINRTYDLGTVWYTGRPARIDPHMIMSKVFHSSEDIKLGYNNAGYHNPEYDRTVDASSAELNREKRMELIWKCQEIIASDVPMVPMVHQMALSPYNNQKWSGFVNLVGNGLKNDWSWTQAKPLTSNRTLVVGYLSDAGMINPLNTNESNLITCRAVYDTLVKVGPDGTPRPWLAVSWRSISPTEMEFSLRKGHKFHDNKPVTARDVKFTFDYIQEKKVGYLLDAVKPIKETRIVDDYTVRFILNRHFAPFLAYSLEQVFIIPEHIWKGVPEKGSSIDRADMWVPTAQGKLIGSGYLKFLDWRKGDEIKLGVNKEHFAAPSYETFILKIVPSPEAMLGRLGRGEIDIVADYQWDGGALKAFCDANRNITMHMEPSVGFYDLTFNCRNAPFDDVVVRRAIAALINREMIANNIWKGFAVPALSPLPPNLNPWYNPNLIDWYKNLNGLKGAREILAKAGYEWDKEGRIYYPKGKTN